MGSTARWAILGIAAALVLVPGLAHAVVPVITPTTPDVEPTVLEDDNASLVRLDPGATCASHDGTPIGAANSSAATVSLTPGTQQIEYTCKDSNGSATPVTRSVTVVDTGKRAIIAVADDGMAPSEIISEICGLDSDSTIDSIDLVNGDLSITASIKSAGGNNNAIKTAFIQVQRIGTTDTALALYNFTLANPTGFTSRFTGDASALVPAEALALISDDPTMDTFEVKIVQGVVLGGRSEKFINNPNIDYAEYSTFTSFLLDTILSNGEYADFTSLTSKAQGTTVSPIPDTLLCLAGDRHTHVLDNVPSTVDQSTLPSDMTISHRAPSPTLTGVQCDDEYTPHNNVAAKITINGTVGSMIDTSVPGKYIVEYSCPDGGGTQDQIDAAAQQVTITVLALPPLPTAFASGTEHDADTTEKYGGHTMINPDGSLDVSVPYSDLSNSETIAYYQISGTRGQLRVYDYAVNNGRAEFTLTQEQGRVLYPFPFGFSSYFITAVSQTISVNNGTDTLTAKYIDERQILPGHYYTFDAFSGLTVVNGTTIIRPPSENLTASGWQVEGQAEPAEGGVRWQASHRIHPELELVDRATKNPYIVNQTTDKTKMYVDPGATCTDSRNGKFAASMGPTFTEHNVNLTVVDDYEFKYLTKACTDPYNGLELRPASGAQNRQVHVRDMTPPVLAFEPYELVINGTFVPRLGVTCTDVGDAAISATPTFVHTGRHNLTEVMRNDRTFNTTASADDTYFAEYKCTDTSGNSRTASRTITAIEDTIPPKIHNEHAAGLTEAADIGTFDPDGIIFKHTLPQCFDERLGTIPPDVPRFEERPVTAVYEHNYLGDLAGHTHADDPWGGNLTKFHVGESRITYTCFDDPGLQAMGDNTTTTVRIGDMMTPQIVKRHHVEIPSDDIADRNSVIFLAPGDLYLEAGADCLFGDGTLAVPGGRNATVSGDKVDTTQEGTYLVAYSCASDAGVQAPSGDNTAKVVMVSADAAPAPAMDLRPTLYNKDKIIDGTEKITHVAASKFRSEDITCRSADGTRMADAGTPADDLSILITAAKFREVNPIDADPDKADVGVTGRENVAKHLQDVLDANLRYGYDLDSDEIAIELSHGVSAEEFVRKAPPGQYEATFDCQDAQHDTLKRAALTITIITTSRDNDWELNPTFGTSWGAGGQTVQGGFSFNGRVFDVTDNFHVDFERTTSIVGETNTVTMKAYVQSPLDTVVLSLGVPELSRVTDSEADIVVKLRPDYTLPAEYEVIDITHEQEVQLIDEQATSVSIEKTDCNSHTEVQCHEFTIQFRIMAPLSSDVLAISAMDQQRRITTTYINDGVAFEGESLIPAETATLHFKRGNQHPVETIHLTQEDRRYNLWADQHGYAWLQNEYGSWFQLTQGGFERLQDRAMTVMTRTHSSFEDLVMQERERAAAVFDADSLKKQVGESFSHDAPVKVDKLKNPEILERLRIAELRALEHLEGQR